MIIIWALVLFGKVYITLTVGVFQPRLSMTAKLGDTVTLLCNYSTDSGNTIVWLRYTLGQKLEYIVGSYSTSTNYAFYNGFKDAERFTVQRDHGMLNLHISEVKTSDSGEYYCATLSGIEVTFGGGTFLILEESLSNSRTVIQQPVSEPLHPGDSVTLQCSIHTETCAGEHSVYWFRQASGESLPGIIYTHGNRSDQCERSSGAGSPTQSCVYKLPKRNLSRSDAGTYYCAVAACGEILYGNGTILDITGTENDCKMQVGVLVLLSAIRTGVLLCMLLICVLFYCKPKSC